MYIETQRLILREFQRADCRELAPILADSKVMKFSPTGVISTSQTQKKIAGFMTCYQRFGFGKWAVILKELNQVIGYCGIAIEQIDARAETEIGYRLSSKYWGQGLATEAASAAIQYGFKTFKIPYILGIAESANIASIKVLKKVGMEYERQTTFHDVRMDVYRVDTVA